MIDLVHKHRELQHDFFSRKSPEADWLAGLLAADGNVQPNLRRWSLSQSGDEGLRLVMAAADLIGYQASVCSSPTTHKDSHTITVTSPQMVSDLSSHYLVQPRKTLTYRWPSLDDGRARVFIRGYIDGDGCIGVYRTPQGNPFLHISFVGTPEFMLEAREHIPAKGRHNVHSQCLTLVEGRWSGRHAWQLGKWLYHSDDKLPESSKSRLFGDYAAVLSSKPPSWFTNALRRTRVLDLLDSGVQPMLVAKQTGEDFRFVYRCRGEGRKSWGF